MESYKTPTMKPTMMNVFDDGEVAVAVMTLSLERSPDSPASLRLNSWKKKPFSYSQNPSSHHPLFELPETSEGRLDFSQCPLKPPVTTFASFVKSNLGCFRWDFFQWFLRDFCQSSVRDFLQSAPKFLIKKCEDPSKVFPLFSSEFSLGGFRECLYQQFFVEFTLKSSRFHPKEFLPCFVVFFSGIL